MAVNRRSIWSYCIAACFIVRCVEQDTESIRDNPFDAGGSNWKINTTPTMAVTIDSLPLWYDFDFRSNTGAIFAAVHAKDNNAPKDSVAVIALYGKSTAAMDTAAVDYDSIVTFDTCARATKYCYQIEARDTWDSAVIANGHFVTPSGTPPPLTDQIFVEGGSSRITLQWSATEGGVNYRVYRANNPRGPFVMLHDTTVATPSGTMKYYDYSEPSGLVYYRLATVNKFGECKSDMELCGYLYSNSVSVPYYINASDGSYPDCIRISWSNYSVAAQYYLHKSTSSSGPYRIIDSTMSTSYTDTIRDTGAIAVRYFYKISARDNQGRRSAPSSYDDGNVSSLYAPSGVSASQGLYDRYILISWYSVSGATEYTVYRSTSSSGTYEQIGKTTLRSYKDSVKTEDDFYYKVRAANGSGKSSLLSDYTMGYLRRLECPSSIYASQGTFSDYIQITWYTVASAAGYYIYRSKYNSSDSLTLFDSVTSTKYCDSVKTTENYYYALVSFDSIGRKSQKSSLCQGYITRLPAPSGFTVSTGYGDCILLSWQKVAGATGYYIYRSATDYGQFVLIDSTTTPGYKDCSIVPAGVVSWEKTYYYKVAAHAGAGKTGTQSSHQMGILQPFSYPANIKASNYEYKNRIVLTWDSVGKATGYSIYRSIYSSTGYSKIAVVKTPGYIDSSLESYAYLHYKIAALSGTVESPLSNWFIGYRLVPPTNIQVSGNAGYISLSWHSIQYAAIKGYYVYRSSDSVDFIRIAIVNGYEKCSYRDSAPGYSKWYYRMSAFSSSEESAYSDIYGSKKMPNTPVNLKASVSATRVTLGWDSVPGVDSFRVYRGLNASLNTVIGSSVRPIYVDSTLSLSMKFYYAVSAVNSSGEGPRSDCIYAGLLALPSVPANLSASGSAAAIAVSWTAESDVAGCFLYRSGDSGKTYITLDTLPCVSSGSYSYYDTVTKGIPYYYQVAAYNDLGVSQRTAAVIARRSAPSTPQSFATGALHQAHIQVAWQPSPGASEYTLFRSFAPDSAYTKRTSLTATIFRDSTVLVNTTYYYKISAFNVIGESPLSGYVSGIRIP